MSLYEYWYKNDIDSINNAIVTSELGEKTVIIKGKRIPINDWIFEKEFKRVVEPFKLY